MKKEDEPKTSFITPSGTYCFLRMPEELKNASPDTEALKRMQSYRADKPAAERFAREGKLADVKVDYNEGGRR